MTAVQQTSYITNNSRKTATEEIMLNFELSAGTNRQKSISSSENESHCEMIITIHSCENSSIYFNSPLVELIMANK